MTSLNRLHKRHGSWGWLRRSFDDGRYRLSFDHTRTLGWHLSVLAILCLVLWRFWGTMEAILAHQKHLPITSSFVLAVCCVWFAIALGVIVFLTIRAARAGDYLHYEPATDRLVLPRLNFETTEARPRVSFSHERYPGSDDDVIELNVVIDGERRPFLHSAKPRGQIERICRWLTELGFTVTRHDCTKDASP